MAGDVLDTVGVEGLLALPAVLLEVNLQPSKVVHFSNSASLKQTVES